MEEKRYRSDVREIAASPHVAFYGWGAYGCGPTHAKSIDRGVTEGLLSRDGNKVVVTDKGREAIATWSEEA